MMVVSSICIKTKKVNHFTIKNNDNLTIEEKIFEEKLINIVNSCKENYRILKSTLNFKDEIDKEMLFIKKNDKKMFIKKYDDYLCLIEEIENDVQQYLDNFSDISFKLNHLFEDYECDDDYNFLKIYNKYNVIIKGIKRNVKRLKKWDYIYIDY